ncbi:MAG: hypothetical protein KVP17_003221 [Porospora cf. gigantea B]|uniref:uncharacterized protein n=1 Tax=Porospora cf. gigantea B TaxID=2853592 RepID=UPI003571C2DC|nr:MAG: hypothetical protein KVP17_003221 [Porospora cf. gigantea B]
MPEAHYDWSRGNLIHGTWWDAAACDLMSSTFGAGKAGFGPPTPTIQMQGATVPLTRTETLQFFDGRVDLTGLALPYPQAIDVGIKEAFGMRIQDWIKVDVRQFRDAALKFGDHDLAKLQAKTLTRSVYRSLVVSSEILQRFRGRQIAFL